MVRVFSLGLNNQEKTPISPIIEKPKVFPTKYVYNRLHLPVNLFLRTGIAANGRINK